jgi:hypothetical protein
MSLTDLRDVSLILKECNRGLTSAPVAGIPSNEFTQMLILEQSVPLIVGFNGKVFVAQDHPLARPADSGLDVDAPESIEELSLVGGRAHPTGAERDAARST